MKFEYGIISNKIDITNIVLVKCIKNNILFIPKNDIKRKNIFNIDPCRKIKKNIYINNIEFDENKEIKINMNKKICICFYGLTRSLKYTINSIQNNILKILIENNYYYDIYLHTYNLDVINNKRNKEINLKLDNQEYKLLNCDYIKIDNQDDFDKTVNINQYLINGDPWPDNPKVSLLNLLRQLNSLNKVASIIKPNINYSQYLYLRPDLKYLNEFDIEIIKNYKNNEFYTPMWGKFGGLNDRLGFGNKKVMIQFANRIKKTIEYSKTNKLHSETFLKYVMKEFIIKDIKMKANRIRANGLESKDCKILNKT